MNSEKDISNIFKEKQSLLNQFKNISDNFNRLKDKGFINETTNSSIGIRENGNINICSSNKSQINLDNNTGSITSISLQENNITNRKNIITDEIIINNHKLNNDFYELSDFKQFNNNKDKFIGNLLLEGSVLVKAWDINLQKYVLIRRRINMSMFSNNLNNPEVPEQFSL